MTEKKDTVNITDISETEWMIYYEEQWSGRGAAPVRSKFNLSTETSFTSE
jgi:hypothetical protein